MSDETEHDKSTPSPPTLRVSLPETMPADMTVEQIVDADIRAYNEWFQSLGNDPVIHFERAAIKTYLAWKLGVKKEG